MTARNAAKIGSVLFALIAGACTNFYEIPIETPIQPKLDVTPFQRVHVVGFISGGSDDVDANLETVRLLRSQLRTRSSLRVIEADVLPLAEIAQEQARDAQQNNGSGGGATTGSGSVSAAVANVTLQADAAGANADGSAQGQAATPQGQSQPAQTPPPAAPQPAQPAQGQPPAPHAGAAGEQQPLAARIKDEKDLAAYERLFANVSYWKKLGEEFQQPLIVTGTIFFTPQQKSGIVTQQQEQYDQLGRRVLVPRRIYMERKGFILRPKFVFIDGRTGTTLYTESFREERLYPAQTNTPALSSYFEMMDTLVPSFLNTLSAQKVKGTRVLLK